MQNAKKLGPGFWIRFKAAAHGRRGGDGARLLDAPHDHTKVRAFNDHGHPQRFNGFHDGVANLSRQTLLHLQSARVEFGNARQFAETELFVYVCVVCVCKM